MSPAQQRLADLLKLDKAGTLKFMGEVFKLGKEYGGVTLREMTVAAQTCMRQSGHRPTPADVIERICMDAAERILARIEAKGAEKAGKSIPEPVSALNLGSLNALMAQTLGTVPADQPVSTVHGVNGGNEEAASDGPTSDRSVTWKQRLADALGTDRAGAEAFVDTVLKLRLRGERFGLADFVPAAEELKRRGKPITTTSMYESLVDLSAQRKKRFVVKPGAESKRKRTHVSVWEIRT